jgi:hypothetical protein
MCQGDSSLAGDVDGRELGQIVEVVEQFVARTFGPRRRLVALRRHSSPYRTSFIIDELEIELDDGQVVRLLRKDVSRLALHPSARAAKPEFLHNPLREIEVYRRVLADTRFGTAICHAQVVDADEGRYWLFLEHVRAVELYQVGDLSKWQCVAHWLAAMHARFADKTDELRRAAPLLVYDAEFYRMWVDRAVAMVEQDSARIGNSDRSAWQQLVRNYEHVIERLVGLPSTLIHGEFYASNVLVGNECGRERVCPVDWEMAAVGPGLIDLAALSSGRWTNDERVAIAGAYFEGLQRASIGGSFESLCNALEFCRVHLAVQWLGWSSDWRPPPEHAQDWLAEALNAYNKITTE